MKMRRIPILLASSIRQCRGRTKTAELRGKYLRVYNESGTDGRLRFTGATAEWTTEAATQGEIDSFTFLHQIRDWGARIAPEVGMVSNSLRSYVNRAEGSCNAYYNGDVTSSPKRADATTRLKLPMSTTTNGAMDFTITL